jgi:hypothetical protein
MARAARAGSNALNGMEKTLLVGFRLPIPHLRESQPWRSGSPRALQHLTPDFPVSGISLTPAASRRQSIGVGKS